MSAVHPPEIVYPDHDGHPMSDNTDQARWIFILYGNLEAQYRGRPDVLIAADNLWYPVEGRPDIRLAPDVYVAFGRPKGRRGSYQQWKEGGTPITVVFEVLSPKNTTGEMAGKLLFYEEHGAEEYYVYDPDANHLTIWTRGPHGAAFARRNPAAFVSPRLGIRFDLGGEEMVVFGPNGDRFLTFDQLKDLQERETARADREAERADQEAARAEQEAERADQEAARAEQEAARAAEATAQAAAARALNDRLRYLNRRVRRGEATPEEVAELARLTNGD